MPDSRSPTQGMTLLEVLVVLAMAGILMAIAASSMAGYRARLAADSFLSGLAADLNVSRSRTMATGQVRRVRLLGAGSYVVEQSPDGASAWTTLRTATAPQNVLDMAQTVARAYVYTPRGTINVYTGGGQRTTSADIRALVGSGSRVITVTALGIAGRL